MNWWRRLLSQGRMERELEKELRFHFEQQVRDYVMAGMTQEEARREARIKLGGMDRVREECRDARGTQWLESTLRDVAYALRGIRLNPAFSAIVVLSVAVGIGANTAIFSVIDALLLKRLPVRDPASLAVLYNVTDAKPYNSFSYPVFEQFRRRNRAFSGIFAVGEPGTMRLNCGEGRRTVRKRTGQPRLLQLLQCARRRRRNRSNYSRE